MDTVQVPGLQTQLGHNEPGVYMMMYVVFRAFQSYFPKIASDLKPASGD